jgi:hypothetical protein
LLVCCLVGLARGRGDGRQRPEDRALARSLLFFFFSFFRFFFL